MPASRPTYDSLGDDQSPTIIHPQATKVMQETRQKKNDSQDDDDDVISWSRYMMGTAYMLAMGVCGTVLVALGSTLDKLAENVGYDATEVGTVFIARGAGAVLGAILSAKFYRWIPGNYVMTLSLSSISFLLCTLPFNKSYNWLHIYFFFLGLGTSITDTGCQIMTRKLHGKRAGPWLGANTVAFGISGAFVPLVEIITRSLTMQYYIISAVVLAVTCVIFFGKGPELSPPPPERTDATTSGADIDKGREAEGGLPLRKAPHYYVEMIVSVMVFWLIGGKVTLTAYLDTYVDDTGIIEESHEATLVLVLWIAITLGRLAGVQDQRFLTNKTLPNHLSVLLIGGFLSMLLIIWFPKNSQALWIGIAFYGLFNGPCVGYCYDYLNRLTIPSEKSMSIVMFGLNFGASLVPYMTTLLWTRGGGEISLMVVTFLSMFIPLPLLHITRFVSYEPSINPRVKNSYNEVPSQEIEDA